MYYDGLMDKLKRWKGKPLFFIAFFLSLTFLTSITATQPAQADTQNVQHLLYNEEIYKDLSAHQHYWFLRGCFDSGNINAINYTSPTDNELDRWEIFLGTEGDSTLGDMYGGDGARNCDETGVVKTAFGYLGATNPRDALCVMDGVYWDNGTDHYDFEMCKAAPPGDGDDDEKWDYNGDTDDQVKAFVKAYESKKPPLTPAAEFLRAYSTLVQGCKIEFADQLYDSESKAKEEASGSEHKYAIPVLKEEDGEIVKKWVVGIGSSRTDTTYLVANTSGWTEPKCQDLLEIVVQKIGAYETAVKDMGYEDTGSTDGGVTDEVVCSGGALGWVICPLSDVLVQVIDGTAGMLQQLLTFQPLIGSPQGEAIKSIWTIILGIANAGLVIAFLIIIFSQATSVGLSTYGIKKLLPRVIAAAILMNLSFYICAIAIDISNIVGVSIKSIVEVGLDRVRNAGMTTPGVDFQLTTSPDQTGAMAVGLLALAITVGTGAIFMLLPLLATGAMALLTALIILAARQVLLTLLIILAPLAILAWILPNTSDWFTKWRKLFTVLLMMFPLIMAIFYGSILVSTIIVTSSTNGSSDMANFITQLIAFLVLVVPLFSLPFVMKAAGGVMERFGVMVNNRNKGLVDRSRKKAEELKGRTTYQRGRELRKRAADEHRGTRFASRIGQSGIRGVSTRTMARGIGGNIGAVPGIGKVPIAKNASFQAQSNYLTRAAQAAEAKASAERVSAIVASYERMGTPGADTRADGYLEKQYESAIKSGNHDQAQASINRLSAMGSGGRNRVAQMVQKHAVTDQKMKDTVSKSLLQDNYSTLVGSRGDVPKGEFGSDGRWDTSGAVSKLGTSQLATQDEKTLYQNFGDISVAEARKIVSEPNLMATVQNDKARRLLRLRATGAAAPPARTSRIDPGDPSSPLWKSLED